MAHYSSTLLTQRIPATRLIAGFVVVCIFMMNVVFMTPTAQAAAVGIDQHHAQAAAASHQGCMHHGDQKSGGKLNADGCHNGTCCQALSTSAKISSTLSPQHPLHTILQPTLVSIVLPTDIRPPILAA